MAYFVSDEFPDADFLKIMKMCLIHDLGEAFTGDIPAFEKTDKDSEKEADVLGYNAARELLKNLGMAVEDLPPSPKVIVDTWE